MNATELKNIVELHGKWLRNEEGGVWANLYGADLGGANLGGANLGGADLGGCAGDRNFIRSVFVSDVYPIAYTAEVLQIGCQRHPIADWWAFDDHKILAMDGKKALTFWREMKDFIRMTIEKFPATPTGAEQKQEETE